MMLSVPYTKKDPVIVEDRRSVRLDNLGPYLSFSTTSRWCLRYLLTARPNPYIRISHSQPVQVTRPGMTLALEAREEIFRPMLVIYMKWFCYVLAVLSGLGTRSGVGQNWISQTACSLKFCSRCFFSFSSSTVDQPSSVRSTSIITNYKLNYRAEHAYLMFILGLLRSRRRLHCLSVRS